MNDVSDWEICDEHEQAFHRHGFCKDCRIAELKSQIKSMEQAYSEGINYQQFKAQEKVDG